MWPSDVWPCGVGLGWFKGDGTHDRSQDLSYREPHCFCSSGSSSTHRSREFSKGGYRIRAKIPTSFGTSSHYQGKIKFIKFELLEGNDLQLNSHYYSLINFNRYLVLQLFVNLKKRQKIMFKFKRLT